MKMWMVGGAVRDGLLGLPVTDRDWVVVGQTPERMLAAGFTPVGKDFPVFLHPQTKEEVALARTERKTGAGYRGFQVQADPGVTLEDDLMRRDLTINAMAQDDSGRITDPHGGPFLFGSFTIADAYFAPVVMRLASYGLPVPASIAAYMKRVQAAPGVAAWIAEALAEHDYLAFEEPYRTSRQPR